MELEYEEIFRQINMYRREAALSQTAKISCDLDINKARQRLQALLISNTIREVRDVKVNTRIFPPRMIRRTSIKQRKNMKKETKLFSYRENTLFRISRHQKNSGRSSRSMLDAKGDYSYSDSNNSRESNLNTHKILAKNKLLKQRLIEQFNIKTRDLYPATLSDPFTLNSEEKQEGSFLEGELDETSPIMDEVEEAKSLNQRSVEEYDIEASSLDYEKLTGVSFSKNHSPDDSEDQSENQNINKEEQDDDLLEYTDGAKESEYESKDVESIQKVDEIEDGDMKAYVRIDTRNNQAVTNPTKPQQKNKILDSPKITMQNKSYFGGNTHNDDSKDIEDDHKNKEDLRKDSILIVSGINKLVDQNEVKKLEKTHSSYNIEDSTDNALFPNLSEEEIDIELVKKPSKRVSHESHPLSTKQKKSKTPEKLTSLPNLREENKIENEGVRQSKLGIAQNFKDESIIPIIDWNSDASINKEDDLILLNERISQRSLGLRQSIMKRSIDLEHLLYGNLGGKGNINSAQQLVIDRFNEFLTKIKERKEVINEVAENQQTEQAKVDEREKSDDYNNKIDNNPPKLSIVRNSRESVSFRGKQSTSYINPESDRQDLDSKIDQKREVSNNEAAEEGNLSDEF